MERRTFLSAALGLGLAAPTLADAALQLPLPPADLYDRDEERYWAELRRQFLIPADVVNLNNGTVGSSPRPVLNAIFSTYEETERMTQADPEDYPIWGYGAWEQYRRPFADFIGATTDQVAILRNATEANSVIAAGLKLTRGDAVLISDEEHGSGEQPWMLRAKRDGIRVDKFNLPKPPRNAGEVLDRIEAAITSQTRIIFVSHISTVSGVVLPAREIAALARSRGILSAFDGAHVPGMMRLNLKDIDCDLYTGSMHKWLFAPKGTGFLYLRDREVMDRIWPVTVTGGWDAPDRGADRYMQIGSSAIPTLAGLNAAIALANSIGLDRIERREAALADRLHAAMVERGAASLTSPDPQLRRAIATVTVAPIKRMELQTWLWNNHRVRIRGGEPSRLRLSTPYYLSNADLDRFLDRFDAYRKQSGA